jgi:tetratricopeptide (TPR) repeat protein
MEIKREFEKEPKVRRLEAAFLESSNDPAFLEKAVNSYRNLIQSNVEDRASLKRYIMMNKMSLDVENLKKNIDLWNEYLKVYMDDVDAWNELSDIYIQANNYVRAIFCLEEVILHHPNNIKYYLKIGDLFCSFTNNADAAVNAVKYYSQSILFKPTPRAFWGLLYAINIMVKNKKQLDDKLKNIVKISNYNLKNFYKNSPFKIKIEDVIDINTNN